MTVPPPTRTARRITQTVIDRAEAAEARVAELEAGIRACLASPLRAVPKHVLSARTGVDQVVEKGERAR